MKLKVATLLLAALCAANVYSQPLLNDSQPLTLKLENGKQATITTCEDFIALRRSGGLVADYVDLSDPEMRIAKSSLTDCYINTVANQKGWVEVENASNAPSIQDVVDHFPATEALAVSNEDVSKTRLLTGVSIHQKVTDLKITSNNKMTSKKDSEGYFIYGRQEFKDSVGKHYMFVTLSAFATGGTYAVVNTYQIISDKSPIWKIEKITENSPL